MPQASGSGFVVVDAKRELKRGLSLSEAVWEHQKEAERQGLELVVELYGRAHPTSRLLRKVWKRRDGVPAETLAGVYLFRVDVGSAGAKAVVALTPYAIFGVPLFVAWNRVGQLLTARALKTKSEESLIETLSAYFQDVASGKPHLLHPAPRLPTFEAQRELHARSEHAADPALSSPPGEAASVTEAVKPSLAVCQLEEALPAFLEQALTVAQVFLEENQLRSDFSLHSLRSLDALLDEKREEVDAEFAGRYLAPLGVYFGCVVCAHGVANWFVDLARESPVDALSLRVNAPEGEISVRPVAFALQRLGDHSRGFYGQAIALCRTV